MVARLFVVCLGMMLPCATLFAAELQSWRDTPYDYDTFNPDQTPWHPPQEKNIEEVFKHHQYFAIVYSAAGKQLAVSRYTSGRLTDTTHWIRQTDGSLLAAASDTSIVSRSIYMEHCATCHGAHRLGGAGQDISAC